MNSKATEPNKVLEVTMGGGKALSAEKLGLTEFEKYNLEPISTTLKATNMGVNVTVGMDLGSTANRVAKIATDDDCEDMFSNITELSSDLGIVKDISHIKSASQTIYDNLEFIVKDVTPDNSKIAKMFEDVHVVKGGLLKSVESTKLSRPSLVSKVKLDSTYINAIITLALDAYLSSLESGFVHKTYQYTPSIALPPEDFRSVGISEEFKTKLAGMYKVSAPRLGFEVNISIDYNSIFLEKEPNAVAYALALENDNVQTMNTIVLDGGGKSTDQSLVIDGVIRESGSKTYAYGGQKMLDLISDEYVRATGATEPPRTAVMDALRTGTLVRGGMTLDFKPYIVKGMQDYGVQIFNDILKSLDRADISLQDIGMFVFHGRLFMDTAVIDGTTGKAISVATTISKKLAEINPHMGFMNVVSTDIICKGVAIIRLVEESE